VRRFAAIVTGLVGCYSPDPHTGAPCTTACPAPLECNQITMTCERPGFVPPDATVSAPGVFRLPITYDAASEGPLTVLVVLDSAQFPYAHAAGDGSDLRFGDADPNNGYENPRWIESWTPTTSLVWVRTTATTVGPNTVWAFYGATGASIVNDFATVFPDTFRSGGNATLTGDVTHDAVIVDAADTLTVTPGAPLVISAAYVRISGTIDANAAGHPTGMGTSTGGTSTNGGGGGAGHGGTGGVGGKDAADTPGDGGAVEGALDTEDIEMGAGGGTTDIATTNGAGGGAIRINALRAIVDGKLLADGQAGIGATRSGGGGAGGGVLVRAQSLSFTGTINARGGKGGQGTVSVGNDGGGGGGGGRIKLFHRGAFVNTGTMAVTFGAGGDGGDAAPGQPGTDGTMFDGMSTTLPAFPILGVEQTL
jgi:hypothetical protein